MHVTNLKNTNKPVLKLKQNKIKNVDEMKYLGIIFDSRLKFDKHVDTILTRAKKLGIIQFLYNKIKGAKKTILNNIV